MSYSFNVNNRSVGIGYSTSHTFSKAIFDLKNFLANNGWIVKCSGTYNGVTNIIQYNSSGDLFTTPDEGSGGFGNDMSWFVITDPVDKREFLFLKNRMMYISGFLLTGGFKVQDSIQSAITNAFIDVAETYIPGTSTSNPTILPAKAFIYQFLNDFEFNGYICFNGFKWYNDSDIDTIIDGKINGIDTPIYVSVPPTFHSNIVSNICGTQYRVYDGYRLNNAHKIGNGFIYDSNTSGQLGASGSGNNAVFINGRVVGDIIGYHIDSGFNVSSGIKTAVSNIDVYISLDENNNPRGSNYGAYSCIDGTFIDDHSYSQTITNANFVQSWYKYHQCFYSYYTVDYFHGDVTLAPQKYSLLQPSSFINVANDQRCPVFGQQGVALPDNNLAILDGNAGLPIGNFTEISGTDDNGNYVPGFIKELDSNGYLIVDGYIITSGHVIRDVKYVYDGYIDLVKKIHIADGYVGNGNVCYANADDSNSNLSIGYSAKCKFLTSSSFYGKAASAFNPPMAADLVWLHQYDTNPGIGEKADVNGYYFPNNTGSPSSLLSPGHPQKFFDNIDFTNFTPTNYLQGFKSYDTWNYHMCVNNAAPYNWYFIITRRDNVAGIIAMDQIYNNNVDNTDNVVFINYCGGNNFNLGASHHSNFIKSWNLNNVAIATRQDFVDAITNNTARFLEANILYQNFYQTCIDYKNLDSGITNINLSTSDYSLSTEGNYIVNSPINTLTTHKINLQPAIVFNQNITITNGSNFPITILSSDYIDSVGNNTITLESNITVDLIYSGKFWIVSKFYSFMPWLSGILSNNINLDHGNVSYMSSTPLELVITGGNSSILRFNDSVQFGGMINVNNNSGKAVTIYGYTTTPKLINANPNYTMQAGESTSFWYDGISWSANRYDGRQINPSFINLDTFTCPGIPGNTSTLYANITSPSSVTPHPQSYYGKLYLNAFPKNLDLVMIQNSTNMYHTIYGIRSIAVNSTNTGIIGYKIGLSSAISIAPGETLVLQYSASNQSWTRNKYTIAIPGNLQTNLSSSIESIMSSIYAKMENGNITNGINVIPNSYLGVSGLISQDTVKRYDSEMLDINGLLYYLTLNLKTQDKPVSNDDYGSTLTLPWSSNTPISPD
jgi:hypothetical protein